MIKKNSEEPLAIVGIGCRFPGNVSTPEDFWNLLCNGVDAVKEVPKDRWDIRQFYNADRNKPGKSYAKEAGFLTDDIFQFDPAFFGISPREALQMDPQQRLLLETTWEAIEDAGLNIQGMTEGKTGVFIGGFCLDNKVIRLSGQNRELSDSHTSISATMTMLANKISYIFDFKGPSITMDTACSSSLSAIHFATRSLRNDDCDIAIVGGVNVMLIPEYSLIMSKGGFLSEHSRCKTFDEDAKGYVRAEGAGIVILKPLSKALADNDTIYAMVKETGANQDGRTAGIALPNSGMQKKLLHEVYSRANVPFSEVQYIEAHGTGTQAGDKAETEAIHEVFSNGRNANNELLVGSVKTNIGHMEAGAGIAGLIKATLCIKNKKIPPNLHLNTPNHKIDFEKMCLRVPVDLEEWPSYGKVAYAGVNSFGYGGANVHVLLEEAPQKTKLDSDNEVPEKSIFPFSGHSVNAVKDIARNYATFLTEKNKVNLSDFLYSSVLRRSHHTQRAAIVYSDKNELINLLQDYADDKISPNILTGRSLMPDEQKLVFVCTGMGPQWWAMGRELLEKEPVYRSVIEKCDTIFKPLAGWSLVDALSADEQNSIISRTEVAQTTNFAVQLALAELLASKGIVPDAVVGHSVGEVAAAYIAGALSLKDALLVSYHRSRLQQKTAGMGGMLAAGLSEEEAIGLLTDFENISIAAINSPSSVTFSGDQNVLETIAAVLEENDIFNRILTVEVPYHCHIMDMIENELKEVLAGLKPQKAKIPLYSTVFATRISGDELNADYWWQNVRKPVRFAEATQNLIQQDYKIFVEVGPHPVLKNSIKECMRTAEFEGFEIPTLVRKNSDKQQIAECMASLYTLGISLDLEKIVPSHGNLINLPSYPWQKEHYWSESERSKEDRLGLNNHVFLNKDLRLSYPAWEVELNENYFPFLPDHQVESSTVFPGAAYVEAALAINYELFETVECTVEDIEFSQMLMLDDTQVQNLHFSYHPDNKKFEVHSRNVDDNPEWELHASGKILPPLSDSEPEKKLIPDLANQFTNEISVEEFYRKLETINLNYGEYFKSIQSIHTTENSVFIKIDGHKSLTENSDKYIVHPSIMDAGFQSLIATMGGTGMDTPYVPVSIGQLRIYSTVPKEVYCLGTIHEKNSSTIKGSLQFISADGDILLEVNDLVCQAISGSKKHKKALQDKFYEFVWEQSETNTAGEANKFQKWIVFGDETPLTETICKEFKEQSINYVLVHKNDEFCKLNDFEYQINPNSESGIKQLFEQENSFTNVLYLWALYRDKSIENAQLGTTLDYCDQITNITKTLSAYEKEISVQIVTWQAQAVFENEPIENLSASVLWGLGHLIGNEQEHLFYKLIDITNSNNVTQLIHELMSDNKDDDVAFRDSARYVKRIRKQDQAENSESKTYFTTTNESVSLAQEQVGNVESLVFKKTDRIAPKPNDIEIQVYAVPLNFKDLLKVYNFIDSKVIEDTFLGNSIGMECSGRVVRIGEDIKRFKVGDDVIVSSLTDAFSSYKTVPDNGFVVLKPNNLRFEDTLVFVPFFTAYYGLMKLAQLQKGEKVLIHNATGGVGISAIQVAQLAGAEIFATAGSPEKRAYLKSLGIKHIYNSRDLLFANQIKEDTDSQGVDVVISAMSGEALIKSFESLASYGRYIEIGKKDISDNNGLPMRCFNRNISFISLDIDRLLLSRPHVAQEIWTNEMIPLFVDGTFKPLPTEVFPAAQVKDAFKLMRDSNQIGKIVVDFKDQEVSVIDKQDGNSEITKEATYLITGGTQGLGFEIAQWLAAKNVKQLVLISRSGKVQDALIPELKKMEANGTKVLIKAVDVSNKDQMTYLLHTIKKELMPLRGIFHGAMVLDDAFITELNKERYEKVLNPKVKGAMLLHTLTLDAELDFFISFSSISSLIGNKGQANYVAANAFLDAFSQWRSKQGLPATTINLGVLAETGVVSRNEKLDDFFKLSGIQSLTPNEVTRALDVIITQQPAQIGLFDVEWNQWAQSSKKSANSSRFQQLVSSSKGLEESVKHEIIDQLAGLGSINKNKAIEQKITKVLADVLKCSPESIDTTTSLKNMGVDSLMTVELQVALENSLGVEISNIELLKGPSVAEISKIVLEKLKEDIENIESETLENLDNLSEQEIDSMLTNLIEE